MTVTSVPSVVLAQEASYQSTDFSLPSAPKPASPRVARPTSARQSRSPRKRQSQPQTPWQSVPLHCLQPQSSQPRRDFDDDALDGLSASIKSRGVLQPLLVRLVADSMDAETRYEIVAGERRFRASQQAGLTEIPVLVQQLDDVAAAEISLIENVQREDLTPLETASALLRMHEQGYSVRKLAARLGKGKGWVEQRLLLARLPQDLQAMVSGRPDTLTHARELEKVEDADLRASLIAAVRDSINPMPLAELRKHIRAANQTADASPSKETIDKEPETSDEDEIPEDTSDGSADDESAEQGLGIDNLESGVLEADTFKQSGTSAEELIFYDNLPTRLATLKKRLPALPPPACSLKRARIVAELADARAAIDALLARWQKLP